MNEEIAATSAARADRAERLLETLRLREPAEADIQASAMVMAGLKMLQEVRGTAAVLDTLSRIGPALVAECPAVSPAPAPAPTAATPEPARPEDLVGTALGHLRALPVDVAVRQARAAIMASNAFLREVAAAPAVMVPGPAPEPAAVVQADHLACSVLDHLRVLPRADAHERARATVAGAAAYLHEIFGRSYASALLNGTLEAATEHGDAMRGGRDSLEVLH